MNAMTREAAKTRSHRADQRPAGGRTAAGDKDRGRVLNVFSHAFLLLWAAMVVLPLMWAVMSSFKSDAEIVKDPLSIPGHLRWENFGRAWVKGHIGEYFLNTVIVLTGGAFLTMLLGSMAAYVLA